MSATEKRPRRKKLRRKKKKSSLLKNLFTACFGFFLMCLLTGFAGAAYIFYHYSKDLPDVSTLKTYEPSTITQIFSDNDELIAEFYIEKRILVPLEKIPKQLQQATLAVEDANFYRHPGIDLKAIFRAMITNFKAGRIVEGGSTITQQLSKTLFLSRAKNIERKIREAILAIRLERIFSKKDILEMYLNQIYYGHGAYGVEAAARTYFGKHVNELDIAECAMIAGLPKAPNSYSPYRNPAKAKRRRNHAILNMARNNFISQAQMKQAMKSEIKLGQIADRLNKAPYFVEYIRQFLEDTYGSSKLYRAGLKVHTTLNINYQLAAQKAVRHNLRVADKRYGYRGPIGHVDINRDLSAIQKEVMAINNFKDGQTPEIGDIVKGVVLEVGSRDVRVQLGENEGILKLKNMRWARQPNVKLDGRWARIKSPDEALSAGDIIEVKVIGTHDDFTWSLGLEQEPEVEASLLSLDPRTGHIKAMIGGYDYSKSQFNRAWQSVRQPGSAFKPIIYTAAINEGFTPASIIIDSPLIFKETEFTFDKWKPVNFEEKFYGPTSLRTAITHSRNVVTIKLLRDIGVQKAIEIARGLGISSPLEENLSIALGSSGVSLFELTSAYAILANLGVRAKPSAVRFIEDRNGNILYTHEPEVSQIVPPGVAYTLTSLLQSVVREGTGKKVRALGRPVAGKTGTTNNFVDAWFMGYTPELATGVWVGNDKDESLGRNETGSRAAIPIWLQYMKAALRDAPIKNFPIPDDVVFLKIDPETGKVVNFADPKAKFEVFLTRNLPDYPIGSSGLEPEENL
ncbi:MAG: penicillin-binding protein 1A [Nitrospinales bacterium]